MGKAEQKFFLVLMNAFLFFGIASCKTLSLAKKRTLFSNELIHSLQDIWWECDSLMSPHNGIVPLELGWYVGPNKTTIGNKEYYKLFEKYHSSPEIIGYLYMEKGRVYFLYQGFRDVPEYDSSSKDQLFVSLMDTIGTSREIRGMGENLFCHSISLIGRDYNEEDKSINLIYECEILPEATYSLNAIYITKLIVNSRKGIVFIEFFALNSRGDMCTCTRIEER